MLDAIDKKILAEVADLETIPKGAYNIRKNGELLGREVSANINIETNAKRDGIIIDVKPGTVGESVHIPVILSQSGLHDVVYNTFVIGENSDVTIVAGCGIHCGGPESEGHSGVHEFRIKAGAKIRYVEKHLAIGEGSGKRTLNPTTKVVMEEDAQAEMELTQMGGADEAKRFNRARIASRSVLLMTERVMTDGEQSATSTNEIELLETDSRSNIISRSVLKDDSKQDFYVNLTAHAKCYGHIECDAILMGNGNNQTVPALRALHPDAELTHEASIGKIANDQLTKLMSLGLTYDEAVNRIIQGFLA
ncbi:Fe-S cluster assembly protein SufD [Desulfosarcina widdelii]|uniref:Fe-S cluster assembly protein SufD n=1 Tax=Desulfosarcina widdelii TaxID=947919 RepID=A0A5K7Z8N2_9BACT|nr:SufD family Fe-S cluster assembly protein [Desulfosarcina widdelii]BBO78196.1 Fe-S cluster assembly protein SufD [Desulfosarcina widdelii]